MNIFIKTFGCRLNISESESIAYKLKIYGYNIVKSEKEADLVIVNSCTVTERADSKTLRYINKLKKRGKKVLITGCLVQTDPQLFKNDLM